MFEILIKFFQIFNLRNEFVVLVFQWSDFPFHLLHLSFLCCELFSLVAIILNRLLQSINLLPLNLYLNCKWLKLFLVCVKLCLFLLNPLKSLLGQPVADEVFDRLLSAADALGVLPGLVLQLVLARQADDAYWAARAHVDMLVKDQFQANCALTFSFFHFIFFNFNFNS